MYLTRAVSGHIHPLSYYECRFVIHGFTAMGPCQPFCVPMVLISCSKFVAFVVAIDLLAFDFYLDPKSLISFDPFIMIVQRYSKQAEYKTSSQHFAIIPSKPQSVIVRYRLMEIELSDKKVRGDVTENTSDCLLTELEG